MKYLLIAFATFVALPVLALVVWSYWPLPAAANLIKTDYFTLRAEFLQAARARGVTPEGFQIEATGPNDEPLVIDIAWIGDKAAERVFLHISGTHGVEGYAGSAIQTELLKQDFAVPKGTAVVFIHALNPWGMAHKRRFNEDNVDVNRNFILEPAGFSGAPDSYRKVNWFLNPPSAPTRIDAFFPQAAYLIWKVGFNSLKQAIAGGQYEYPKGIYYGGSKLTESNRYLRLFIRSKLKGVKQLYVVEVHTGLGESGKDVLFWPYGSEHEKTRFLEVALDETLSSDDPTEGVGFKTPGDLQNEAPKLLPEVETYWLLQEFGAYGPVKTLRALRNENRYHQYTDKPSVDHWTKRELVEAFSPGSKDWQEQVLARGRQLGLKFIDLIAREGSVAQD